MKKFKLSLIFAFLFVFVLSPIYHKTVNAYDQVLIDQPCVFIYSYDLVNNNRAHAGAHAGYAIDLGANGIAPTVNGQAKIYQRCQGSTALASISGTVTYSGWDNTGYGNRIDITDENGNKVLYAHMQSISASLGQYVRVGDTIGIIGSTGNATFNHIHFEVYKNGIQQNYNQWLFGNLGNMKNFARIGFLRTNNLLKAKEGSLYSSGIDLQGNVSKFQFEGDRTAYINLNNELWIKEGSLHSSWIHLANNVTKFKLFNDRIIYLNSNNELWAKEGRSFEGQWYQLDGEVVDFDLDHSRIVWINASGYLKGKQGSLLSTGITIASNVQQLSLTTSRLAWLTSSKQFWVREGNLITPTQQVQIDGNVDFISIDGVRIGWLKNNGQFWMKNGDVSSSASQIDGGVVMFKLRGNRIGWLRTNGEFKAKEGELWSTGYIIDGSVNEFDIAGNRLAWIRNNNFYMKEGSLTSASIQIDGSIKAIQITP